MPDLMEALQRAVENVRAGRDVRTQPESDNGADGGELRPRPLAGRLDRDRILEVLDAEVPLEGEGGPLGEIRDCGRGVVHEADPNRVGDRCPYPNDGDRESVSWSRGV